MADPAPFVPGKRGEALHERGDEGEAQMVRALGDRMEDGRAVLVGGDGKGVVGQVVAGEDGLEGGTQMGAGVGDRIWRSPIIDLTHVAPISWP